jgi:hypothetical protein
MPAPCPGFGQYHRPTLAKSASSEEGNSTDAIGSPVAHEFLNLTTRWVVFRDMTPSTHTNHSYAGTYLREFLRSPAGRVQSSICLALCGALVYELGIGWGVASVGVGLVAQYFSGYRPWQEQARAVIG